MNQKLIAEPGGILVSDKVQREINGRIDLALEDQGDKALKNISTPVRVLPSLSRPAELVNLNALELLVAHHGGAF
jgi:class 3 adenylate cyclase